MWPEGRACRDPGQNRPVLREESACDWQDWGAAGGFGTRECQELTKAWPQLMAWTGPSPRFYGCVGH